MPCRLSPSSPLCWWPIARDATDLVTALAATKIASRTRRALSEGATMQAALGRAEALLRSARAFLYNTFEEAWSVVSADQRLDIAQRAQLSLAATHTANTAQEAAG